MNRAAIAINAAKHAHQWGVFAALRYALKKGATLAQFNIAYEFEQRRALRRRLDASFAGCLA